MSQIFNFTLASTTVVQRVFQAGSEPNERFLVRAYHSADAVETSLDQGFATVVRDIGSSWYEFTIEPGDKVYCRGIGSAKYFISRHPAVLVHRAIEDGFNRLLTALGHPMAGADRPPEEAGYHDSEPDLLDQLRACR